MVMSRSDTPGWWIRSAITIRSSRLRYRLEIVTGCADATTVAAFAAAFAVARQYFVVR